MTVNLPLGQSARAASILVVDDETDVADLFRQRFRHEARQGTYGTAERNDRNSCPEERPRAAAAHGDVLRSRRLDSAVVTA